MIKGKDRYGYTTFCIGKSDSILFLYAREFIKEPKETRYHIISYDKIDFVCEWDNLRYEYLK